MRVLSTVESGRKERERAQQRVLRDGGRDRAGQGRKRIIPPAADILRTVHDCVFATEPRRRPQAAPQAHSILKRAICSIESEIARLYLQQTIGILASQADTELLLASPLEAPGQAEASWIKRKVMRLYGVP